MIRVILFTDPQGQITGYSAHGHSDYAEIGYDIVCAGISVLGCTCINSLESVCGIEPVIDENESGALAFHLPLILSDSQKHDAQILMNALRQGVSDIAEQYPKEIKFSIKNGGK